MAQKVIDDIGNNPTPQSMMSDCDSNFDELYTHKDGDGSDHSDVALNNTHRSSDGSDHSFIDQDVTISSAPVLDATNFTNLPSSGVTSVNGDSGPTVVLTQDDILDGVTYAQYSNTDKTKVGHISVTQAVDLDTMESDITINNAKVTNATHTGDVTGDEALTITADAVNDTHIDWGVGTNQVSAVNVPITDAGGIITATEVEGALQENRTNVNLNTTHRGSNGTDHTFIDQDVTTTSTPTFSTIDLTGGQLKFPATFNLSSDPNTLDDYEEGTMTPGISFGGGTTGITYAAQVGTYTKIGRVVMYSAYIQLTSKGTSTGTAVITGLPFSTRPSTDSYAAVSLRAKNILFSGVIQARTAVGSPSIGLFQCTTAGIETNILSTDFLNNSLLMINGNYHT